MEIDVVSDTQTVIGALLTMLNPAIGLAILADSLINNHEVRPTVNYLKDNPNLHGLQLIDKEFEQLEYELEAIAREAENGNLIINDFTFDAFTTSISIDVPRGVPILLTNEHFSRILIKFSPTFGVSSVLSKALGYFSLSGIPTSTDLRCTNH
jgi:hypothetical protein